MRRSSKQSLCAAVLVVALAPLGAYANIESQLDSMFNSMSNSTNPGMYQTATRGVVSGGSMRIRNQIATAPVVSFRPPSFQAGCGGIDMFAGSFSFINAQQFVQSLRSIASNSVGVASGYAFKLALKAMGPTVENTIANLQETMQDLNGLMSNSCQLAQGLVTDAFSAFEGKDNMQTATGNTVKGLADSFGSLFSGSTNSKSPTEEKSKAGNFVSCEDTGNVVWCAMQQYNSQQFFKYGSQQTDEMIMSFTGSVVISGLVDAADGKGQVPETTPILPTSISLQDIIEGQKTETVQIYSCGGDKAACLTPSTQSIAFDGLAEKIIKGFNGSTSSVGIVHKWATNTGTFNNDEQAILNMMQKPGFAGMVQRLSQGSESMARGFVSAHAKMLALEGAYSLVKSYIDTAETVITRSKMVDKLGKPAGEFIGTARDRLVQEHQALLSRYGNENDLVLDYEARMKVLPTPAAFINVEKPVQGAQ
ncbi:IncF plasmid conjugative transfer pilus assembly protein TraH [Pseudomonas psychrotolerans L19]|uniref:conjugal transfer protein TraH n=1 Tax=Pseudomonas oryzihabitans TaxID=47885 RepID=UPI00023A3E93|nr:conjugal transfer protein TraH [Pseudomonas psychrotolerans]EHK69097.1 IncF plasmid conjugative transfer pilus assembly protein TraH [Pseudomonas psychrotolerans L19]